MTEKVEQIPEFNQFWSIYPRKIARAHAFVMWQRLKDEEKIAALAALPVHLKLWQAESREPHCIPHAATWLNPVLGRRWEDEIELPKPKADPGWMKSEAGIIAEGKRRGLEPKRGEDLWNFRARVEAA